jgi:hypothetical protein
VLGYFGFDRTLFGVTSPSKNRKWWHQLKEPQQKDADIEKSTYIYISIFQLYPPIHFLFCIFSRHCNF